MILADTSIWVAHFRVGVPELPDLLDGELIAVHPVVIGELAVGNLSKRAETLEKLRFMPSTKVGTPEECLAFIESHRLYGRGLGWNDIQLLVAARISGDRLWSFDKRLALAADELGVAYSQTL